MTKKAFDKIAAGLREIGEIKAGRADPGSYRVHVPADVDVKSIRGRLNLSQAQFAERFGIAKATLQDWEQKRRQPEATARILLTVIDREPEAVARALDIPIG